MTAEKLVRRLDELTKEADCYEDYMLDLRLGRGLETTHIRLRKGVFGFGWTTAETVTPMPPGLEAEFYEFLGNKASDVGRKIRDVKERLAELDAGNL